MTANPTDPGAPRPGGLQSMLARLKGIMQGNKPSAPPPAAAAPAVPSPEMASPALPADVPGPDKDTASDEELTPAAQAIPVAQAIPAGEEVPVAEAAAPVPGEPTTEPHPPPEMSELSDAVTDEFFLPQPVPPGEPAVLEEPAPVQPAAFPCPICGSLRQGESPSCHDCGYYFSEADLARSAASNDPPGPAVLLQGRFERCELQGERCGTRRYRGLDHAAGGGAVVPVVIVEQQIEAVPTALPVAEALPDSTDHGADEVLPGFDDPIPSGSPVTEVLPDRPSWPSVAWEESLLQTLELPGLPRVIASFTEGEKSYLVEEAPAGRSLWDAWDDPESGSNERFGWLAEIAEVLHRLHQWGAMLEGLRPDLVIVDYTGHARLRDLGDLLPLPVPEDAPIRGSLYTAPELTAGGKADARAELYSFGAMLYALHVGRELSEGDFDRPGQPKPFLPRFPDIHPAFGRLMTKTFRREVASRFPTDEAGREDPTGFVELVRTLTVLRRTLDNVRLEIASWTTTGIVRTGNEDAYAVLHACETRQDDCAESALVLLCDGMGGYEAGEVAAALCIQVLRQYLTQQKLFAHLGGAPGFPHDALTPVIQANGHLGRPLDVNEAKQVLKLALREANRAVFTASRAPGSKRRGMGCTAEAVYVDGRNVVVGHVGDSRTYHLHEGRLIQLTRDQTLVNRLVELGTLTPEEAESHPRRNELQQAIGGQPDVEPGLYHGIMRPGDWVVVCSDGVTNHVNANDLKMMLQSEAQSAEMAARRLVNLVNIEGATDNATVVVIRAT